MSYSSARALLSDLDSKRISALEALEDSLRAIDAQEDNLGAMAVRDDERARVAAKAADQARARGDHAPLLGLPVTVKESFRVAGLACTWGNPEAAATRHSTDAVAVARLKKAGAVVAGKTNVAHNLQDWQTHNPLYGRSNNPWDCHRTPGGSSGGSAAALAAGYVSMELGSDLGGSLRIPAHFCGVYAHKPSQGLIPMRGHAPPGAPDLALQLEPDLAVVGPMARSADDLELALSVLAGPDQVPGRAYQLQLPPARSRQLADFRVLVLTRHPRLDLDSEVGDLIDTLTQNLAHAGCRVQTHSTDLPSLALIDDTFTWLLKSFVGAHLPDRQYGHLQTRLTDWTHQHPQTPPPLDLRALTAGHRDWIRAHQRRQFVADTWERCFQSWDVVVCPVMPTVAFPHDARDWADRYVPINGHDTDYAKLGVWAGVATLCGLPATSIPIGVGRVSSLPVGVQVVGPFLEDLTPLAFAQACETAFGGFTAPPLWERS
jgi:amidase